MNFNKITPNKDLSEYSEEELRELVEQFQDAQEDNVAEFESAKEKIDDLDGTVSEYEEAKQGLIESVTEFDAFEDAPITEDALQEADFTEVREWSEYFEEQDESVEDDADEDEPTFDDMGTEGPVSDDNEPSEELKQYADVPGALVE